MDTRHLYDKIEWRFFLCLGPRDIPLAGRMKARLQEHQPSGDACVCDPLYTLRLSSRNVTHSLNCCFMLQFMQRNVARGSRLAGAFPREVSCIASSLVLPSKELIGMTPCQRPVLRVQEFH